MAESGRVRRRAEEEKANRLSIVLQPCRFGTARFTRTPSSNNGNSEKATTIFHHHDDRPRPAAAHDDTLDTGAAKHKGSIFLLKTPRRKVVLHVGRKAREQRVEVPLGLALGRLGSPASGGGNLIVQTQLLRAAGFCAVAPRCADGGVVAGLVGGLFQNGLGLEEGDGELRFLGKQSGLLGGFMAHTIVYSKRFGEVEEGLWDQ